MLKSLVCANLDYTCQTKATAKRTADEMLDTPGTSQASAGKS